MLENNYDIVADVTLQSYQEAAWNSRKYDVCNTQCVFPSGCSRVGLTCHGAGKLVLHYTEVT